MVCMIFSVCICFFFFFSHIKLVTTKTTKCIRYIKLEDFSWGTLTEWWVYSDSSNQLLHAVAWGCAAVFVSPLAGKCLCECWVSNPTTLSILHLILQRNYYLLFFWNAFWNLFTSEPLVLCWSFIMQKNIFGFVNFLRSLICSVIFNNFHFIIVASTHTCSLFLFCPCVSTVSASVHFIFWFLHWAVYHCASCPVRFCFVSPRDSFLALHFHGHDSIFFFILGLLILNLGFCLFFQLVCIRSTLYKLLYCTFKW